MTSRYCHKSVTAGLRRCHGRSQKRARKTPGRVLVLGINCQSNSTLGTSMATHLFRIPVTSNHNQYLPNLFLSSSWGKVREDYVVRELRPYSELVIMTGMMENEVEFTPVLCVGRWPPQVMY